MNRPISWLILLSSAPIFALGQSATADDLEKLQAAMSAQMRQLETQQTQLAEQHAELAAQQQQAAEQAARLKMLESARVAGVDVPRWTMAYGKPILSSADGRYTLSPKVLVQADYAHYAQDEVGTLAADYRRGSVGTTPNRENGAARDLSDGLYFRRARLGVEGTIDRNFNYRLVMELGGSGTEGPTRINDAWISYTGFAPFAIQFGAGAPPANLDDSTAPEDGVFLERATAADIARGLGGADGRTQLGIKASGARWMTALALTGRTVNDAEVNDSANALVARVGALALTSVDYNVHIGASQTYMLHAADAGADASGVRSGVRLRSQPELRVDSTRLIDTGSIDALHAYARGIEFGANWRNFQVQAENFWFGVERRDSTLADPTFSGWYAQGTWLITGEAHRYNVATASFQNPRPFVNASSGGWGAWELAFRYSHMNLDFDPGVTGLTTPTDGIRGGIQNTRTFGINWYLNPNVKIQLNYLNIAVNRLNPSITAFGAAPNSPPVGVQIGQSLDAAASRVQYAL